MRRKIWRKMEELAIVYGDIDSNSRYGQLRLMLCFSDPYTLCETDRQTHRQAGRRAGIHRPICRQSDRQTDRQTA